MLNWVSGLTREGRLDDAVSQIETALTALGTQWVQADHEVKLAGGQLMMDTMRRLIPGYDLSRNMHVQFFSFVRDKPVEHLEQGAKQFSELAAAAKTDNPPLFIVMGTISQLFSLFAINATTKRDETRNATGALYTAHSRNINDMIQYVLYHAAIESPAVR
jgi:hypothetical protein